MPHRTALVTDSSATLPAAVVAERGIAVVPLQVVIAGSVHEEGVDVTPDDLATALGEWRPVSTSRPTPEAMLRTYRRLADEGAEEILAVHLSGDVSGTFESAQLAAKESPVPVTCVDSRQIGIGTGFLVLAAADLLDAGGSVAEAAALVERRAAMVTSLFYVDTLEHLRRGGRVGAAAAFLGSALAVKPILTVEAGRVGPHEKVRTSTRALARLEELAVEAAGRTGGPVDVGVSHLASPERAAALAERLTERLGEVLEDRDVLVGEVGAALGAHVGPGMVAVVVAPRTDPVAGSDEQV
ncbi:MAG: DegV family protein [Nocardioides sp.]|nr:DegV family protein [Nocardioides sp.]